MGEVVNMERRPQLNVNIDGLAPTQEAATIEDAENIFGRLERLIDADPRAVLTAIKVYNTNSYPAITGKSINELLVEDGYVTDPDSIEDDEAKELASQEAKAKTEKVTSIFDLWKTIEQRGYYKLLDNFDPEVEALIKDNEEIQSLRAELRDSRNRNTAETQAKIRATRMQIYIGQVIASRTLTPPVYEPKQPAAPEHNGQAVRNPLRPTG